MEKRRKAAVHIMAILKSKIPNFTINFFESCAFLCTRINDYMLMLVCVRTRKCLYLR